MCVRFKLLKVFAGHLELLAKLKRGGEQTVRVEHVHVHAGGQAKAWYRDADVRS